MDKVGGRDSVDFIANLHEMDGLGIELWWGGARFYEPRKTGPAAYTAFYTMRTASFPGVKR